MEAKFARVNMIDFLSEEALAEVQNRYVNIREKTYPGLEFTVWGPYRSTIYDDFIDL